jgi:Fe-S-cluster containining protein
MAEDIFQRSNRVCQKEINIFLDPNEIKRRKGKGGREQKIKKIGTGQRLRALKKWLDFLHKEYVKDHEQPCQVIPCIDCCHTLPIIRSRSEFEYLKRAVDLNQYAKSIGDSTAAPTFKVWSEFCKARGINPHNPFLRPADVVEWIRHKIPCPLYSSSYGKCLIEDTKPIDCRFGRNATCPHIFQARGEELAVDEIVEMTLDLRIAIAHAGSNLRFHSCLFDPGPDQTWVDVVNNTMVKADRGIFPDRPVFSRQPIYTLFKFGP